MASGADFTAPPWLSQIEQWPVAQAVLGAALACDGRTSPKTLTAAVAAAARGAIRGLGCLDAVRTRDGEEKPFHQLEHALALCRPAAGEEANISGVKAWLRGYGDAGRALATRIGKLSKVQNGTAHPDINILQDIANFVAAVSESRSGGVTEGPSADACAGASDTHCRGDDVDPEPDYAEIQNADNLKSGGSMVDDPPVASLDSCVDTVDTTEFYYLAGVEVGVQAVDVGPCSRTDAAAQAGTSVGELSDAASQASPLSVRRATQTVGISTAVVGTQACTSERTRAWADVDHSDVAFDASSSVGTFGGVEQRVVGGRSCFVVSAPGGASFFRKPSLKATYIGALGNRVQPFQAVFVNQEWVQLLSPDGNPREAFAQLSSLACDSLNVDKQFWSTVTLYMEAYICDAYLYDGI